MPFVVSPIRERIVTHVPGRRVPEDTVRINPPPRTRAPHPAAAPDPQYKVGYGRPPEHSKFKHGRSGNPKGRPKGAKSLKTIAQKVLTELVTVRTPTGSRKMTKMEAGLLKMTEKAFSGDMRALQAMAGLYAQSVPDERPDSAGRTSQSTLDEQDAAALAALTAMVRASITDEQDKEDER